jgi:hypothetical protein
MSWQHESGWERPRHRGRFTQGFDRLDSAAGGRLSRRPRGRRAEQAARRASRPRRAVSEAVRARDHAARRMGKHGGARRATSAVVGLSHPPPARSAVVCGGQRACRASPALVSPPGPPLPRRPHQKRNPQGGKPIPPRAFIGAALRAAARGAPGGGSRAPRAPVRPRARWRGRRARGSRPLHCRLSAVGPVRPPQGGLPERTGGAPRRRGDGRRGGLRVSARFAARVAPPAKATSAPASRLPHRSARGPG